MPEQICPLCNIYPATHIREERHPISRVLERSTLICERCMSLEAAMDAHEAAKAARVQ